MSSSFDNITAFPLCWPEGWQRTPSHRRSWGPFDPKRTREKAVTALLDEIRLLGGRGPILSSMLKLRQDGLPYSNQRQPDDPGIAVYFTFKGKPTCFACDTYNTDAKNIWAIKLTIEALRGIERWGASDMLERAFTGFAALPAPEVNKLWYLVMDLDREAPLDEIERRYRELAREWHPDAPNGSHEAFIELQQAFESGKAARNA